MPRVLMRVVATADSNLEMRRIRRCLLLLLLLVIVIEDVCVDRCCIRTLLRVEGRLYNVHAGFVAQVVLQLVVAAWVETVAARC